MSQNPPEAENLEFLQKYAKKLVKHHEYRDTQTAELVKATHPQFANLTLEQIFEREFQLTEAKLVVARDQGFTSWSRMKSYIEGRPRFVDGQFVISETPGLETLEEKLNDRARLHGMPPIGSRITSQANMEWEVLTYGLFAPPSTIAVYPNEANFLPVVWPLNPSQRLTELFLEVDRCTSKEIVFVDTAVDVHPRGARKRVNAINLGGPDTECWIFLDIARSNEFVVGHELAHNWKHLVDNCIDYRRLRDKSDDRKVNQLDFLHSMALDLGVNDLLESCGFDMETLNNDHILGLQATAHVLQSGCRLEDKYEEVVAAICLASATLECHRMPVLLQNQLATISKIHKLYVPDIYDLAQHFISSIVRHNYDTGEAIRKIIDDVVPLAFRFTGDEFDVDLDLEQVKPSEGMKDKYPDELVGFPVPLKLEVARSLARNGVRDGGHVDVTPVSPDGYAAMIFTDENGQRHGPFPLDYKLPRIHPVDPRHQDFVAPAASRLKPGCGLIKDQFGRLPGHRFYNCCIPPERNPVERIYNDQKIFESPFGPHDTDVDGSRRTGPNAPDAYGRSTHDPYYNSHIPKIDPRLNGGRTPDMYGRMPGDPFYGTYTHPDQVPPQWRTPTDQSAHDQFDPFNPKPPKPPKPGFGPPGFGSFYMAGLGRSVAETRLAQMLVGNVVNPNLYQYANNNPVNYIDPSGDTPTSSKLGTLNNSPTSPKPPPTPTQVGKDIGVKCQNKSAKPADCNRCVADACDEKYFSDFWQARNECVKAGRAICSNTTFRLRNVSCQHSSR